MFFFKKRIFAFDHFFGKLYAGAWDPGGSGGVGPPLELEVYVVKILKIRKFNYFSSIGPPLGKNCSLAPDYTYFHISISHTMSRILKNSMKKVIFLFEYALQQDFLL